MLVLFVTAALTVRTVAAPPVVASLIVGRAVCADATWLLTNSAHLIRVPRGNRPSSVHQLRDVRSGDRFWGLACLDDGSLWMLETGRVLARLTPDGAIVERRSMLFPQVELFGAGSRLVLLGLPIVPNRPLLASSSRDHPDIVSPWEGLMARAGFGTVPDIVTNLVACGIGFRGALPCWLNSDDRISISDGTLAREVSVASLKKADTQPAPIRDAALVESGALWILASSRTAVMGRRVGNRLIRVGAGGAEEDGVPLGIPARLILAADAAGCLLLTVTGQLISVSGGSR